jgi:hypothetical protein
MTIVRIAAGSVFIQRSRNVQRMHICNDWYFSGTQRGKFPATCRRVLAKSRQTKIIALPHLRAPRSFMAHDQPLAAAIPGAHDESCTFCLADARSASTPVRFLLDFVHTNKGGTAVDLALRLNVLAVCAVFAFVGAILLGAF